MSGGLTGSSVGVAIACTGRRTLPVIKQERDDELRPHLARGTAVHKFLEDTFNLKDPALALARMEPGDTRSFCTSLDTDSIIPLGMETAELAWAYDVNTRSVRVLGCSLDRRYDVHPGEIPGTADCVFRRAGDLGVADYKITDSDLWAPAPKRSGQLKFLGMCAMRATGAGRVILQTIRVGSSGKAHVDEWIMDEFECSAFEDELHRSLTAPPVFVEGPHCQNCGDRFKVCPAKTGLLRNALVESHEAAMSLNITEENAPKLVQVLADLKELTKFYENQLKEYAKDFPVIMPNGDIFGPQYRTYRTIAEVDPAYAWIVEAHGQDVADRVLDVKKSITLDSLTKELGKPAAEKTMRALQDLGHVSVRETSNVALGAPRRSR